MQSAVFLWLISLTLKKTFRNPYSSFPTTGHCLSTLFMSKGKIFFLAEGPCLLFSCRKYKPTGKYMGKQARRRDQMKVWERIRRCFEVITPWWQWQWHLWIFWPYAHISKQLMNLTSNFFFIWPSSCKNVRIISLLSIDRHRRRRCPRFQQKEISHVHRLVWLDPIVRRSQSDFQFRSIKASIGTRSRVQWLIFASKVASKVQLYCL